MPKNSKPAAVQFSPRQLAAFRAHRTMVSRNMKGTRGKARAALKTRIARYDDLISVAA